MTDESISSESILGSGILESTPYTLVPLEKYQSILWHPVYINAEGDSVQIRIYLTDSQMLDKTDSEGGFELEGLILYSYPTATR